MQIVYSTQAVDNLGGRKFQNPRYFFEPISGATKVYLEEGFPEIRKAYESAGVEVAPLSDMRAMPGHAKPKSDDLAVAGNKAAPKDA